MSCLLFLFDDTKRNEKSWSTCVVLRVQLYGGSRAMEASNEASGGA